MVLIKNSIFHWVSFSYIQVIPSYSLHKVPLTLIQKHQPKILFSLMRPEENQKKILMTQFNSSCQKFKVKLLMLFTMYTSGYFKKISIRNQTGNSKILLKELGFYTFYNIYHSSFKLLVPVTILGHILHSNPLSFLLNL